MASIRVLAVVFIGGSLAIHFGCEGQTKTEPLKPAPKIGEAPFKPPARNVGAKAVNPPAASAGARGVPSPAPAAPLMAEKFAAHTPQTLTYETDKSTPLIAVQEAVPTCHCAGQKWWVRYYAGDTSAPAEREVHMTIDQNGSIAEMEEIDRVDKVEVVYTPPLVLIPDKLPPKAVNDAIYRQDVKMVVHPLGDRTKIKAHGPAKNEIVFEGDEVVHTGAGDYTAHRITATLTAELSAAKTVDTTETWLVDGIGTVIQRDHEETRVMGARIRDNTSTLILRSFEQTK
ncbi:MAG TPA: hypothetical protein VHC70_11625 [Phycisphaerales bacterium]|nr:hypothetical protein [Phycisphaerales bacterium]